jgi:hypothetical protein
LSSQSLITCCQHVLVAWKDAAGAADAAPALARSAAAPTSAARSSFVAWYEVRAVVVVIANRPQARHSVLAAGASVSKTGVFSR